MVDYLDVQDECTSSMEVCYMQLEASWLIKQEVPIVCKRVKRILERCVQLLKPDRVKPESGEYDISSIYFNVKNSEQQQQQPGQTQSTTTTSTNQSQSQSHQQHDRRGSVDILKDINNPFPVNIEELDDIFQDKAIENKSINFETQEGSRGTLNINGWLVESPELLIKFSKPSKPNYNVHVYKTLINKTHPWRIQQIQNSYNYLHLILTELDNLIVFSESYVPLDSVYHLNSQQQHHQQQHHNPLSSSGQINNNNNNTSTTNSLGQSSGWIPSANNSHRHSYHGGGGGGGLGQTQSNQSSIGGGSFPELNSLVESFTRISEWLSQARDELLLPSRNVFPSTMYQSTVLQPPLPFEINVNLTVANCELVLSVYELQITSTSGGSATSTGSSGIGGIGIGIGGGSVGHSQGAHQTHDNNNNNNNSPSKHLLRRSKAQNITSTGSSSSNLATSTGPILRSSSPGVQQQDNAGSSTSLLMSSSDSIIRPTSGSESSETTNAHGIPPFQTTKGGSLQLVTVIDHTEFRQPIPTLVNTFTLLTNAYDRLADLNEKLLVLSNFN
ncbi:hypothetical protein PPL_11211 [Heterostelium album PN500]|uniref:Uncharacterized protein n=1 Tax=Heterostelium pallidum (strain ATCC 26659 / Pp 5 / PN500) TaxID=670386 RepID=D3BTV1_HETP5|nr:hypothetical protein PPL_11211 [Heterostelium album PN500]EFA75137.1 hypothetical protein PPL_11211 [Heterostelium album PN500]|eukprot:XP_020427271.1 hypothetical protein PPL_11211 [Heterostelium album PN500]